MGTKFAECQCCGDVFFPTTSKLPLCQPCAAEEIKRLQENRKRLVAEIERLEKGSGRSQKEKKTKVVIDTRVSVRGWHFGTRIHLWDARLDWYSHSRQWLTVWVGPIEFTYGPERDHHIKRRRTLQTAVSLQAGRLTIRLGILPLAWRLEHSYKHEYGDRSISTRIGPLWFYANLWDKQRLSSK